MVSVSTIVGMLQEPILGKHLAQKTLDKRKLSLLDFCYDEKNIGNNWTDESGLRMFIVMKSMAKVSGEASA